MKILLGICVLLTLLTCVAYKAADRSGDNFGAAFPALVCFAAAGISWIALAVWAICKGILS